ncbi:hypothetical protein P171DRAFT_434072 [Karstenula rhodostoma CBS 690.94]|uniref:C3H1-type domain-containing protein n=1 Tax=Karstenula rhodostoma CBS 690.94 TaxID=1392251 RepID=A0A9P4UAT8_9PLEO|nr:hypothetical protein P171DRAFT_434072 [Karstenula rhodostoma CBS 690.94]
MAPFKFPPPPPPPPPKASNDAPTTYGSQRGGPSGRGDRGRGRGGAPRGRGQNQSGGTSRGGYQRGGHRGGQQQQQGGRGGSQTYGIPFQQQRQQQQQQQQQQQSYTAPQSYATTNFAPAYPNPALPNSPANNVPPLDPGAFAQAMAFMATPVGMQTMAAFAANMANGSADPVYGQSIPPQQSAPQSQSSQPQASPRKRKRNERVGQWQPQQPPNPIHPPIQKAPARKAPSQKPPRAKAKAPPSIPGFGFSLPTIPQPTVASKAGGTHNQHQKRVNLGLTSLNYDEESSSEEDDDVDEEALLAAKWDGKGMTFEHNGETISLQTAAEFAEYIKDRKMNFPTQVRIAEKAQLAAERRANELEFLRRVKGVPEKGKARGELKSKDRRKPKEMSKHAGISNPRLEELREKVKNSMGSKHATAKPPSDSTDQQATDLGLGYGTDTESDRDSSILSESSVVSSDEFSEDDASDLDAEEAEDSDAPPEAQSSKIVAAPLVPPPPPPPRLPAPEVEALNKSQTGVCQQWKLTGRCKYKYCKNKHGGEEPKRIGLYEKMVEQELDKADRLALEAIKYLGRNGFLG